MSVNRVFLLGTIDSDIRLNEFPNGKKAANFILVTDDEWVSKGETKHRQERHKIAIFNDRIADYVGRRAVRGTRLYLEGRLESREWLDPQNIPQKSFDVVLRPGKGDLFIVEPSNERLV